MLTFFHEGDYLFSKLQKNAAFDPGLTLSDLGLLAVLEFHKTNPNYKLNISFIEKISDSKNQYKILRRAGYLTEINHPGNHWNWEIVVDSFNIRNSMSGVIYLKANGDVSSVREDLPYNYMENSTRFIKVPKDLILTKKLSLSAKGLYIKLLSLSDKEYSRKEIFKKSMVSEYSFDKAWDELKCAGYLKLVKKPIHRGMHYDFILNLHPSDDASLIQLKKDGSFNFDKNREGEITKYGKEQNKSLKSKSFSLHLPLKDTYSIYSYFMNIEKDTKTRDEHLLKILKTYKEKNCDDSSLALIQEFNQLLFDKFSSKKFDLNTFVSRYEMSLKSIIEQREKIRNVKGFLSNLVNSNFKLAYSENFYDFEELLKRASIKLPLKSSPEDRHFNKFGYYQRNYDFDLLQKELCVNKAIDTGYDIYGMEEEIKACHEPEASYQKQLKMLGII